MAELVHQTWSRVTGKPWSEASKGGYTTGSYDANIALQKKLLGGWNPYGGSTAAAPAPAPAPQQSVLDFTTGQNKLVSDEAAKREATSAAAREKLVNFYNTLEAPEDRYNRFREEHGVADREQVVNDLIRNIMGTQDTIEGVKENVTNRSRDFLMSQDQVDSLAAKERLPHQEILTKLLRSKEYEEVGLQGIMNNIMTLMNLSAQGDELKARPLHYGVDWAEKDKGFAVDLMKTLTGRSTEAYGQDVSLAEQRRRDEEARAFEKEMAAINFNYDKTLKNMGSGSSAADDAKKLKIGQFNDTISRIMEMAKDPRQKNSAQNELYEFLRSGGSYEKSTGQSGATLASSLGLDPEQYWALWRSIR